MLGLSYISQHSHTINIDLGRNQEIWSEPFITWPCTACVRHQYFWPFKSWYYQKTDVQLGMSEAQLQHKFENCNFFFFSFSAYGWKQQFNYNTNQSTLFHLINIYVQQPFMGDLNWSKSGRHQKSEPPPLHALLLPPCVTLISWYMYVVSVQDTKKRCHKLILTNVKIFYSPQRPLSTFLASLWPPPPPVLLSGPLHPSPLRVQCLRLAQPISQGSYCRTLTVTTNKIWKSIADQAWNTDYTQW